MINEFERYHGLALREIIVRSQRPIAFRVADDAGRINTFALNDRILIHIKHSSKRLPPWQFTFLPENLAEIDRLTHAGLPVWLILVCGQDGIVAISLEEFRSMNPEDSATTSFVRVDRDRNTMYRINGTEAKLSNRKARGLSSVISSLESN